MIRIDFTDEGITERLYRRVDAMTGPAAWQEVSALLQRVRAMDSSLFMELEPAVIAYASAREDASLTLGIELATSPSLWLLAPLPAPPTDEEIEKWKQEREARKQAHQPGDKEE